MRMIGVGRARMRDADLRPVVAVFLTALGLALFAAAYPWILC